MALLTQHAVAVGSLLSRQQSGAGFVIRMDVVRQAPEIALPSAAIYVVGQVGAWWLLLSVRWRKA
jgi:hypothetical protein